MRPFQYKTAESAADAVALGQTPADAHVRAPVQFLAGGTTLIDLMKIDVMRPEALIDIKHIEDAPMRGIDATDRGLRIGSLVSMAEAADNATIKSEYPVLSQSLWMAASQQLRNMATLGGNVLQRTRCNYFRDTSYSACNKRNPGSGCAALDGFNRLHAVLGGSDACIASYPGDFAQALIALGASVETLGQTGARTLSFAELHRDYGADPHIETTLKPGELITAFLIPAGAHTRRSLYLKIRDRESYEFALTSAAVALDLDGDRMRDVRIALGGVATKPWRSHEAEDALRGQLLTEDNAMRAAGAAFASAQPRKHNAFKVKLGQETIIRALMQARSMEISDARSSPSAEGEHGAARSARRR
jgi:xanthine dehydrogenase YagS FAD-binding subunit